MDKKNINCKTKYPLVFVHGIGYDDNGKYDYWGDIPKILETKGATVFFGEQKGFGGVIENAKELCANIKPIADEYGKVNLIAHSKGGIEARYMISQLGMKDKVASLTTMATPHRGIKTMDIMKKKGRLSGFLNYFRVLIKFGGGKLSLKNNDFEQMSEDYLSVFNEYVKDEEGVYYQSYAFDMKSKEAEPGMAVFHKVIRKYEGENDGIVPVDSAKWGDFRGVQEAKDGGGISHSMAAGGRGKTKEEVTEFYVKVVERLKKLGY